MKSEDSLNYIQDNNIFILGDFDSTISTEVIKYLPNLIKVVSEEKHPIINIFINSSGGYTHILNSMLYHISSMKRNGIKIVTHNLGNCSSCASHLFIVGDERYMLDSALLLFHYGEVSFSNRSCKETAEHLKYLQNFQDNSVRHMEKYTKIPKKEIDRMLSTDNIYLTAEDCKKFGVTDYIVEG